jgi:membrane dipeptidase
MDRKKIWNGYNSWDFLEAGVDWEPYPVEEQLNRFPEYDFGLTKTQEERVEELIEKNIIMSFHEHLNVFPLEKTADFGARHDSRIMKPYEGLAHSGVDVIFEGGAFYSSPTDDATINYLGMSLCDYSHQELVVPIFTVYDILRAHKENKVSVIMSEENLTGIGQNIDKLDLYWGMGSKGLTDWA